MSWQILFTAMLPEHILLAGMVVLIGLEIASLARVAFVVSVCVVTAATVAAVSLAATGYAMAPFPEQFSVAPDALLAKAIVLALAIPVLLISRDDFADAQFHILVIGSLYGVCLLLSADSFLILFLGIELMSLPVYVLVLLAFQRTQSAEAALKYLVLGGTATAMFLMGASLLYGGTGSLAIDAFPRALTAGDGLARAAVVLVLLAFFLKAAIVPFHAWAPDAYEAASVPVTAYMATIVKAAVLLAALRLFGRAQLASPMLELVVALPLVSIVWGNLAAMRQPSLRRLRLVGHVGVELDLLVPGEHVHGVAGDGVDDAVRVRGPLLELLVGRRGRHLEHPLVLRSVEVRRGACRSNELLALLRDRDGHDRLNFSSLPTELAARLGHSVLDTHRIIEL